MADVVTEGCAMASAQAGLNTKIGHSVDFSSSFQISSLFFFKVTSLVMFCKAK